jgi:hypothetical protein
VSNGKNQQKPNGHAGPQGRVNGHALDSTEWGGTPVPRDQAASDDTRRESDAMDASSTLAPGADCEAYAEVAPPHSGNPKGHLPATVEKQPRTGNQEKKNKKNEKVPGGVSPLPEDPAEFVEEIHRSADLFISWQRLLNAEDEKIRQRAVEKLTEMRYKGAAALADEPQPIVIDIDSAVARRAAEGARK